MADKRMFSKTIIDSDAFLDMPLSSQALYFHLSMRADDDGFINNYKKIMRMVNATQNDYDLLIAKRFIIAFDSGVIVIKHWKLHNYIRSDRYTETVHIEEKSMIVEKENKVYTAAKLIPINATLGIPCDNHVTDDVDTQIRVVKSSVGISPKCDALFNEFWDVYPKKVDKKKAQTAFLRLSNIKKEMALQDVKLRSKSTDWIKDNGKYIPYPSTYINGERWNDNGNSNSQQTQSTKSEFEEMYSGLINKEEEDYGTF